MLNKILAFSVLSLVLLLQPARAETQQNDSELDSFIQALPTLNTQQKAQLLDEMVSQVNERYAQRPETEVVQSMRLSHNFPEKPQLTYTFQLQPAFRTVLDRSRERFVQLVETGVEQSIPCFPGKIAEAMNRMGVRQIHILIRLQNETVWEQVRDLPVCR